MLIHAQRFYNLSFKDEASFWYILFYNSRDDIFSSNSKLNVIFPFRLRLETFKCRQEEKQPKFQNRNAYTTNDYA